MAGRNAYIAPFLDHHPEIDDSAYIAQTPSESTKTLAWWVNAKFQWGGLVGSARERSADVPKSTKRGFTEDDQERLFHRAHDGKVERGAKRGLGGKGVMKTEHTGVRKTFSEQGELLRVNLPVSISI